jgi:polyadenylate-binding protein
MAENAINHVNGMLLNERQVYVGFHVSKKERESKLEEMRAKFTNIYVKNLDASVTEEEFKEIFTAFGPVTSISYAVDDENKPKEFGFVNYERYEDAHRAVDDMNEKEFKGKTLFVGRAQKKAEREEDLRRQYEKIREEKLSKYQGINLYVKNLDDTIDDAKIREEFANYGIITSAKVMTDEKGASKGFGFVCFSNPDEATKAVTEMNGRIINGKPIYVALAQRKEARRAQLAAQIQTRNTIAMNPNMMGGGVQGGFPGSGPMFYPPQGRGFFPGQPQMMGAPRPGWNGPGRPGPGRHPQFPMPPQQQGFNPGMQMQPGQMPPGSMPPQGVRPQQMQRPGPLSQGPQGRGQPMGARPMASGAANVAGRGRPGFKYTAARNPPMPAVPGQGLPSSISPADLVNLSPEHQKRFLGENLFPRVQQQAPSVAGKVTGMLLEMDNSELLHLLESPETLKVKVSEAVAVLEKHISGQE